MERDRHEPFVAGTTTPLSPYRPRHFRSLGSKAVGPITVKLYSIRCDEVLLDEKIVEAGELYLRTRLPGFVAEEGDHHRLGFAILHEGEIATWLLVHWWAHADILCQRIAHTDQSGKFVGTDRPFHGCVWEGVVVTHEHRTWVESMLTESPDPGMYLGAFLPDGAY